MDVDDDDEYMNAAAAHAALVMTVSAARMYWLLRHAQHARDINIHKLHPLPEKNRLIGSAGFLHRGTGHMEIAVFVLLLIFCRFRSECFRTSTGRSEKYNHDFNHDFLHSGTPL